MANLRVDKITSTETFETTGSVQFDGTNDGLTVSDHADFDLGTGDFTIEGWYYLENFNTSTQCLMDWRGGDGINGACPVVFRDSSSDNIYYYLDGGRRIDNIAINWYTWFHLTICRSSGKTRLFIDGVERGSFSDSFDYVSSDILLGLAQSNNSDIKGNISNYRVVKGKALYTSNFKPPMRELEVTPETVLLCCQSKTDTTLEKTSKTITVRGDAVANELTPGLLTPVPKAGAGSAITGSVEFDGNNDYLSVQSSTDFDFGTGDFTIELYANLGNLTNRNIFARNDSNPSNTGMLLWHNGSGQLEWQSSVGNSTGVITVTTPLTLHEWAHIAVSRESNTTRLFANGVLIGSTSDNTDISGDSVLNIGSTFAGTLYYVKGFISNLRMVKGTALYTDDFTPPTRELKKVPGTVLLCCQDPDNPLTEATGKTITGYGSLNQSYGGTDLVTNGEFTADSDWTKGDQWTISGNSASITDSPNRTNDSLLTQDGSSWIQAGQIYRVAVDWSITSGDFDVRIGGDASLAKYSIHSYYSSPYYFNIEAGATNTLLEIIANQHMVGSINSIHVDYAPPSKAGSNFTPQVGDDRKVTFEGVTKINSDAYFCLPTGDTASRETTGTYNAGTRGLMAGGYPSTDVIQYVTIDTLGNAQDFGNLAAGNYGLGACASRTRGLFLGGQDPAVSDRIQFVTIASTGNTQDFGDLTVARRYLAACSNSTRGVAFGGGIGPGAPQAKDEIDYVTIASTGDAQNFGDLTGAYYAPSGCSSSIRGISFGGRAGSTYYNIINYFTIPSTGNALDYGDLATTNAFSVATSNSTRGLVFGGLNNPTNVNTIQFVTIASMGNAQDFGDLPAGRRGKAASASATRAISSGGYDGSDYTDAIEFVTIPTTGNAIDFGNLTNSIESHASCSNGHGGLG